MELTREKAIELFRQIWSDMKESLGDCPTWSDREDFKYRWCRSHTPEAMPENDCYLCEYATQIDADDCTNGCPIDWGGSDCMNDKINYRYSPISKILALSENEIE